MEKFKIDSSQEKYLILNYCDKENDFNTITKTEEIYNNLTQISDHTYSIQLFLSFSINDSITTIDPDELSKTHQDLKQSEFNIEKKLKEESIEQEQSRLNISNLREKEIQFLANELKEQKLLFEKNKNDVKKNKEDYIKNNNQQYQEKINNLKKQIHEIEKIPKKENNINCINNNYIYKMIRNNIMQNINSFKIKFIEEVSKIYIRKIEEFIKNLNIKLNKIKSNIEENSKKNSSLIEKNQNVLKNQILSLEKEFDNFSKYTEFLKNKINDLNKKNQEIKNIAKICQTCENKLICENCKESINQTNKLIDTKNDTKSKINNLNNLQKRNMEAKSQNDIPNYRPKKNPINNLSNEYNINSNINSDSNTQNYYIEMKKMPTNSYQENNNKIFIRYKNRSVDTYGVMQKQEQDELIKRLTNQQSSNLKPSNIQSNAPSNIQNYSNDLQYQNNKEFFQTTTNNRLPNNAYMNNRILNFNYDKRRYSNYYH